MTIITLVALLVIVFVFVIIVALQPAELRIARSTVIAAPADSAFAQISDLHKWLEVSPYTKLDQTASYAFDGPPAGVGASLRWIGNSKIGEGRMTIVESRPNELIQMKLEFLKPFASTCVAEFSFRRVGEQTSVTWSMVGPKNFISKAAGLVINMDKMIGGQFEEGLSNLRRVSEAAAKNSVVR
jgi:hypothetical protein